MDVFDETLRQKLEEKFEDPQVFSQLLDEAYYIVLLQNEEKKVYLNVDKDGTGNKEYFMCKTCKLSFLRNKIPSRCILNECRTAYQPEPLRNMTEVEATLIAQNLQFQKIHRLPKSRWAQLKDKVINVPVPTGNIKNTLTSLPKNPSDSGLIGVNFKRKVSYKNIHKKQLVDVNRIFAALEFLVENNPLYQESDIDRNFIERCKTQDPTGYEYFIEQTEVLDGGGDTEQLDSEDDIIFANLDVDTNLNTTGRNDVSQDGDEENQIDRIDEENNEEIQKDPVRRYQFAYDEHVALASTCPVAHIDGNSLTKKQTVCNRNSADVAPGEGQIPTNVLTEKQWDIKTYPHLFPDGKNGMNAEGRQTNLTNQQYIKQKLFNVDKRFANDPAFLFSATSYIENLQLQRNISMNYSHGSKTVREGGSRTYDVTNSYCVFTKISNTPEYWKVKKMELLSRLDNLGPFNFFFTLSCADQRWTENFSAFLHEQDIKVTYERNSETPDIKTLVTRKLMEKKQCP